MEDIKRMVKTLRKLNPNTRIRIETSTEPAMIIARCPDCDELYLPKGYSYLRKQEKLTNEVNNNYGSFDIMTEYDYFVKLA